MGCATMSDQVQSFSRRFAQSGGCHPRTTAVAIHAFFGDAGERQVPSLDSTGRLNRLVKSFSGRFVV